MLVKKYPDTNFIHADPNEDWEVEEFVTVIDTVINTKEPIVLNSLEALSDAPRISMHDFDALAQLKLLMKLGRIKRVKILGLPPNLDETEALIWLDEQLT